MARGSVKKRGNLWTAIYDLAPDADGKRRQRRESGFRTKREAQERLTAVLRELDTGTSLDPQKLTVAEYLVHWYEIANEPNVLVTSAVVNERDLRLRLIPALGQLRLTALTDIHIARLHRDLDKAGFAPKTIHHTHATLHAALDQAVRWRLLGRNPCDDIHAPHVPRYQIATWDGATVRRFLAATADDHAPTTRLFVLALGTGLRRGELLALTWPDVDLDRGTLSVRRSRVQAPGGAREHEPKGKRSRVVDLSPQQCALLLAHRQRQAESRALHVDRWVEQGYVFACPPADYPKPLPGGRPYSPATLTRAWPGLLKRLGLPRIRLHDLRHAHASLMLAMGVHPKVVQERLGHATMGQTMDTYSHVAATLGQAAAARWDAETTRDEVPEKAPVTNS